MAIGFTIFGLYFAALGALSTVALLIGVPMALAARRFDWAHETLLKLEKKL